jgi:hypothetical protein
MSTGILRSSIFVLLLLLNATLSAASIKNKGNGTAGQDSSKQEKAVPAHSLYAGAGGGTELFYLGSSLSNNNPFYAASVTYGYKNSLYATVSATHLPEFKPYVAFFTGSLNFSHAFNSWFDLSADVAWYRSAQTLNDTLFNDFLFLNITPGFDWKVLYTQVSFSEILSAGNGFYIQVGNSHYFDLPFFKNTKYSLSADPSADLLFGPMITARTMSGGKKYSRSPFIFKGRRGTGGNETYTEQFGLIDINFAVPVTFSAGRFSIEAEPAYLLPVHPDNQLSQPGGFTFYLNIFLKIL